MAPLQQPESVRWEGLIDQLGMRSLDELTYVGVLGVGGQGVVCHYQTTTLEDVAVKLTVGPTRLALERLRAEVRALKRCGGLGSDTFVAARSDVIQVRDLPVFYFIMDIAPGVRLADLYPDEKLPMPTRAALLLIRRIAWALSAAHVQRIAHRDLHEGNIYVDDSRFVDDIQRLDAHPGIWLIDLGVQKDGWGDLMGDRSSPQSFWPAGSLRYMAPEALRDPSVVDTSSDAWAIGVHLYRFLTGSLPHWGANILDLIARKEANSLNLAPPGASSDERRFVADFLARLLAVPQARRYHVGAITKVAGDGATEGFIDRLALEPDVWEAYFESGGDVWVCSLCEALVVPDGTRCPGHGGMVDDWWPWPGCGYRTKALGSSSRRTGFRG